MSPEASPALIPTVGLLATVRNRRGVVSSVEPFEGHEEGVLHLVSVEYTDADGPTEEQLIWEREPGARLVPPNVLPRVDRDDPMAPADFDALVRAARWGAIAPFVDPDGPDGPLSRFPVSAPLHGAIQIEDFQLVPLLKALRMPRVALLIADDVGLGKTIEAGLVLAELIIRRRVRRALVLCPASLRTQWRQEMHEKFALSFDEVDRAATHALRREMGLDANPWRTFSRVVASYHYLRQPDVLEEFLAASRTVTGSPHLPWDLLIVDEAHNLSPAPLGEDSDLCRMLAAIAPYFEHKVFLTATPHNGHTRSFTGLLELLDPVRFTRSSRLEGASRARVEDVLVRRLKREINALTDPPRFAERSLEAVRLRLSHQERALSSAFDGFRTRVRSLIARARRTEQLAGSFAVEILGKRLLSCPVAFADSWHRYCQGAAEPDAAAAEEVRAAERATRDETGDDREAESRAAHATRTVGAWLKPLADQLTVETATIAAALRGLGLDTPDLPSPERRPIADSRLDALVGKVESLLRDGKRWRDDERLIVFTEYKTTLDYLKGRFSERYPEPGAVRVLFGGMGDVEREEVKAAFNDPSDPVRLLLATDAASEGLNLQETARYLLHYDIPWNPSRLEQRNGRLDRHGQARDVTAFHFETDDDADLKFLSLVVGKVDTIREDLGSVGEVFDAAVQRRFLFGESAGAVLGDLDAALRLARGRADVPRDRNAIAEARQLDALRAELDLRSDTLRDTLEAALSVGSGRPRFQPPDGRGRVRFVQPIPPEWNDLVDDSLRVRAGKARGALPALVFDPGHFVDIRHGRPVFRPEPDTALLHLAHPLYHRALTTFARLRFPGAGAERRATRWAVRHGPVPPAMDALLLLTIEELAVNELRERFHHWVRTVQVPVGGGELGAPLPHAPAARLPARHGGVTAADVARARGLWDEVESEVRTLLADLGQTLTAQLRTALATELERARQDAQDRFTSRQRELIALMGEQSLAKLEREIEDLDAQMKQGLLVDSASRVADLLRTREAREEELKRRQTHYVELKEQLARERERVVDRLLPARYALRGMAQCFPVAVEVVLPPSAGRF